MKLQTYGSVEKISLPFVMGIMADLSGQVPRKRRRQWASATSRASIWIISVNSRSRSRRVPLFMSENTLTGEGQACGRFDVQHDGRLHARAGSPSRCRRRPSCSRRGASYPICSPIWTARDKAEGVIDQLLRNPELLSTLAAESKGRSAARRLSFRGKIWPPIPQRLPRRARPPPPRLRPTIFRPSCRRSSSPAATKRRAASSSRFGRSPSRRSCRVERHARRCHRDD